MKNIIILTLIFFLFFHTAYPQNDSIKVLIKDLLNKELIIIKTIYTECITQPEKCYGDSLFYKTWLDGLENELRNNLENAVVFYNKALSISRFELSTYEVMYSLGRIELLRGNTKKGIEILNRFIMEANDEINDDNAMWGFSDEGLKQINQKIENSKQLINKCQ